MQKIQLNPFISFLLITVFAAGATMLIVHYASIASDMADGYTTTQLVNAGLLDATTTPGSKTTR